MTTKIAEIQIHLDPVELENFTGSPGDYLVVGDPKESSTWHLQYKVNGKPDKAHCAAAYAALTSNFRGHAYAGPDKAKALKKLHSVYNSQGWDWPGDSSKNSEEQLEDEDTVTMADLSYNDKRSLIEAALSTSERNVYVSDMYDDYAIYTDWSNNATYKVDYTINDDQDKITVGTPVQVVAKRVYEPIAISAPFNMEDFETVESPQAKFSELEVVRKRGKIFEVGEFPDKDFSMSEEELQNAIDNFHPVPIDLEHSSTILDGQLGLVQSVSMKGQELWAEVDIPKWLDDLLEEGKVKASATWKRSTKLLEGLALTKSPRIADAVLMAAFSESVDFAGRRNSTADQSKLQAIHDASVTLGADCGPDEQGNMMDNGTESKIPSNASYEMQAEYSETDETPKEENKGEIHMGEKTETTDKVETVDFEAQFAQIKAQMEKVEAENKKLRDSQRKSQAVALAEELVSNFRMYPAEKDGWVDFFNQVLMDDNEDEKPTGLAHFGSTKTQSSRIGALKVLFALRPSYEDLTKEGIEANATDDGVLLFSRKPPKDQDSEEIQPLDPARRKKLLSHTSLGTSILEDAK